MYCTRFNDATGNLSEHKVPRPAVVSRYFSKCNGIDAHNQARQGILKLEKCWITHDPWFRIATTLFGMTMTDCWKAFKYALPDKHPQKNIRIVEFADRMAYELVHNKNSTDHGGGGSLMPLTIETGASSLGGDSVVSPLTQAKQETMSLDSVRAAHVFVDNPELETDKNGKVRPMHRKCSHVGCKRRYHKLCSHYKCRQRCYNVNGTIKYGYFYCEEHKIDHWMDVINGSIG